MSPLNQYDRDCSQLADESAGWKALLEKAPPQMARLPSDNIDRRDCLRLLGASLALAGLTLPGCRRWPAEEIRPHASQPEGLLPGVPQYYATCFELDGAATGILAKSYDGRPIKIEGNPEHPFSLGATDAIIQASILELYDPERSHRVLERPPTAGNQLTTNPPGAVERTWADFDRFATQHFRALRARQGEGLALLVQPNSSPALHRLRLELEAAMPSARWFHYQPLHHDNEYEGSRIAFQRALRPQYDLVRSRVIAAFDADLLGTHPAKLRWARDWASGRQRLAAHQMNRCYVAEPGYSITGSVADCRLAVRPSAISRCVAYVAARLGLLEAAPNAFTETETAWLDRLVSDLISARGESIVATGPGQAPVVHQWIHAINHALGNHGRTIRFSDEPLAQPSGDLESIRQLSELLKGNAIRSLVIIGGNPVYDAPSDAALDLSSTRSRPLTTFHLSYFDNETSAACQWHVPAAHFLECWGDGRAWDGTWTIQQPLILPLFNGRSPIEMLSQIAGDNASGQALVRATFDRQFAGAGQQDWERALHDGLVTGSQFPEVTVSQPVFDRAFRDDEPPRGIEVRFSSDAKVFDGRFANNAWLQELPDPITKLTWDNAALLSKAEAAQRGIRHGDLIRIQPLGSENAVEIAAFILPGHAAGCITLPLGYGRQNGGMVGAGVGCDVFPLRTTATSYGISGVNVSRSGRRYVLATTQRHHLEPSVSDFALKHRLGDKGQPGLLVHEATLEDFLQDRRAPHRAAHQVHPAPLFDPPQEFDSPHRWGMVIDLNACIGCSGCVVACQAENNIPVVGKEQVANNREMHWLRIDRYFKGSLDDPDIVHVPITCAHCENAPCEQVCPVAATVHDSEGLNAMVYNRCIGTRYCANNCPFKVRRFNFFDYHATHPGSPARPWVGIPDRQQAVDVSPLSELMHNPEVTVRMRGVMEKCTYCIQRIVAARISAKNAFAADERPTWQLADGEVQTACQASCPTQAIRFGDLNDPHSDVSLARRDGRHYEVLEELNLQSRTTHLAKIRNR